MCKETPIKENSQKKLAMKTPGAHFPILRPRPKMNPKNASPLKKENPDKGTHLAHFPKNARSQKKKKNYNGYELSVLTRTTIVTF